MKEVIKVICDIQIEALNRIVKYYNEHSLAESLLKDLLQISEASEDGIKEAIKDTALDIIEFYTEVKQTPNLLGMANEYQLLVCSHILFKIEDELINNNPDGVHDTWSLIHRSMAKFHPEYSLII